MDLVASAFDFNDHAYRRFVEKIKNVLDPNGILSAGKQGIWPKKYEGERGVITEKLLEFVRATEPDKGRTAKL